MNIPGKHLTIDRISYKINFSLLMGEAFFDELSIEGNVHAT